MRRRKKVSTYKRIPRVRFRVLVVDTFPYAFGPRFAGDIFSKEVDVSFDANKIKLIRAWLDAQRVNRFSGWFKKDMRAIISAWCGVEVTEEEINAIINVHPRVSGTANNNNISRRLTCPCDSRLAAIDADVSGRTGTPGDYYYFENNTVRYDESVNDIEWKKKQPGNVCYEPPEEIELKPEDEPHLYEGPPISAKKFLLMHTAAWLESIGETDIVSILGENREDEVREEAEKLAKKLAAQAKRLKV